MSLWSDNTISTIALEAENEIATQIKCINKRIAIAIIAHTSVYAAPDDIIAIRRLTWLGKKLEPMDFRGYLQFPVRNPAGDGLGGSDSLPESGLPYSYFYSGFGENVIKLFPTPNINLTAPISGLFDVSILTACIMEYYALPDISGNTYRLPPYIARRVIKSYVLAKIFSSEGPGQDLIGAERHKKRYEMLMKDFRSINSGIFISRVRSKSPIASSFATKISRPRLPTNFGTVVD